MAFDGGIATLVAKNTETTPVEEKADLFYLPRRVPEKIIEYGLPQIRKDYESRISNLRDDDGPIETQRIILRQEMEIRLHAYGSIGNGYH